LLSFTYSAEHYLTVAPSYLLIHWKNLYDNEVIHHWSCQCSCRLLGPVST